MEATSSRPNSSRHGSTEWREEDDLEERDWWPGRSKPVWTSNVRAHGDYGAAQNVDTHDVQCKGRLPHGKPT